MATVALIFLDQSIVSFSEPLLLNFSCLVFVQKCTVVHRNLQRSSWVYVKIYVNLR